MNDIRANIGEYPGVAITVDKDAAGPPAGKPVNIEVRGFDFEKLVSLSEQLKVLIKKIDNNTGINIANAAP